ncbi:MAG: riboflavin biosynthesis protein RibF [Gemmatimonadetes bacterium]|nr:riboflavin biosynthesis protein RibF [Gemmatimonadota bacterium]
MPGPFALTVGVFDGVHRGHVAIVDTLLREARTSGASSVVVTLDPHPLAVLRPEAAPPMLSTADERCELLSRRGPDATLVYAFDRETAGLAPPDFLERLLPPGGDLAVLVIGYDFRMGKNRAAGLEELRDQGARQGFRVVEVRPEGGSEPISSTRIRALVGEGRVSEAAELLGHRYLIQGEVIPGRGIGRTLQFPTANVDVGNSSKLLPRFGVYAVLVRILGDDGPSRPGVMNLGVRPTFGATEPVLEVHLLDFEGDLRGRTVAVELVRRIREEQRFDGPEALAARIGEDVAEARKILLVPPGDLW